MVVAGHSTPRHGNNLIYLYPQLAPLPRAPWGNPSPPNPTDPPPMKWSDLSMSLTSRRTAIGSYRSEDTRLKGAVLRQHRQHSLCRRADRSPWDMQPPGPGGWLSSQTAPAGPGESRRWLFAACRAQHRQHRRGRDGQVFSGYAPRDRKKVLSSEGLPER
jgi:hypothetical protein